MRKDQTFGNYYGAIEPFSIKIEPDDTVTLQSNLIDRAGDFEETVPVKNGQTLQVSISAGMLEDTISQCPLDNILEQLSAITQKAG